MNNKQNVNLQTNITIKNGEHLSSTLIYPLRNLFKYLTIPLKYLNVKSDECKKGDAFF